jgi:DNA-directed RNA polymerase specialized sigma24 family protein
MLNIDTLNHLTDLAATTLYSAEVAHLPKLSREAEAILIERARQGDSEARESLIISCLSYTLGKARFIYFERRPLHDDLLDLVQEASVLMVTDLDKALKKTNPASYLRGIAYRTISQYCTYHSALIQKPEYPLEKLAQYATTVESLDAPIYNGSKRILVDLIEAPKMPPEQEEKGSYKRYAMLHKAIHALPKNHQATIIRLYGLFGQPMETVDEIGTPSKVYHYAYKARVRLRALLTEHVQMLSDTLDEER